MTAYTDTVEFTAGGEIASTGTYPGMSDYGTDGTDGTISQFSNKKEITLSHTGALTDYQKLVTISYESAMQADFADLRFSDASGNYLNYWIKSKTDSDTADVWIKSDYGSGDTVVTMYYGNVGLSDGGSIDGVMDFGDDYAGTTIDTAKWDEIDTGAHITQNEKLIFDGGTSVWGQTGVSSDGTFARPFIYQTKWRTSSATNVRSFGVKDATAGVSFDDFVYMFIADGAAFKLFEDGSVVRNVETYAADTDYWLKIEVFATGAKYYRSTDNENWTLLHTSTYSTESPLKIGATSYNGAQEFDDTFVRQYTEIEPTYSIGAEQIPPAGIIATISYIDTQSISAQGEFAAFLTYLESFSFIGAGSVAATPALAYTDTQSIAASTSFAVPTTYIFIDMDNLSAIGWSVAKTIQDPLWKLSTQLTGADAPTPFRHLRVIAPDHNDVDRTVFIGFLPQARTNLSGAGSFTSLSGFDYAWYLTSQYIAEAQRITDEDTDPSTTITNMLGGADWAKTTGIEPYNIDTVVDWANIKKSYIFDPNASKWKCIQEICEHTNHIFVVKWTDTGTDYHPIAYFIHEDDIDTDLDLPALVTITAPDSEFVSASKESQQVDKINRVVVKGANKITGVWYDSVVESAEVSAGEEIPIEYRYESTDLDTQVKADARATTLYNFYNTDSDTYTINFKQRMDLELYQRIQFSGYADIATGVMRIISIRYGRKKADSDVEIVVAPDQNLSNLRALSRLLGDDFMNTQDRIKEQFFIDLTKIAVGTVQSVDGNEVVVALERDGGLVTGRSLL